MELSAFAWLFSLCCKFLVIPGKRTARENTKRGKTYVWYLHRPQMSVISKLKQCQTLQVLHFAADSNKQWLELASARLGTASGQKPPSKKRASPIWRTSESLLEQDGSGNGSSILVSVRSQQSSLSLETGNTEGKKNSMNRAERTNSLGARFLQKRSMGTICQAVQWNTGLNSTHLDIPPLKYLKYLHMCLGVSNVSLNWGL